MDPAEERRNAKRQIDFSDMVGFVADAEYGIPRRCACGGRMIDEVSRKDEYDSQPGKRFFTCINHEADGLHFRQPWVTGVQEEIERLTTRVEDVADAMMSMSKLTKKIETLQEQVKLLFGEVDVLSVKVGHLEKVCYE